MAEYRRDLLCDPQTSGGLLIAVTRESVDAVLAQLHAAGFTRAAVIGEMQNGVPNVEVI
jgi:selenide,water dikinase